MNPIYQAMMNNSSNNPISMLNELRNNPVQFLIKQGFNVPHNISNDPNSIIQYLLNSGQISQDSYNKSYNQVAQMMQNFRN